MCVQYQFAILESIDWRQDDHLFKMDKFFYTILETINIAKEEDPEWYHNLIEWWNLQVFGTKIEAVNDGDNQEGPSTVNTIHTQLAAIRKCPIFLPATIPAFMSTICHTPLFNFLPLQHKCHALFNAHPLFLDHRAPAITVIKNLPSQGNTTTPVFRLASSAAAWSRSPLPRQMSIAGILSCPLFSSPPPVAPLPNAISPLLPVPFKISRVATKATCSNKPLL
ncbi:hypothetical protein CVT25_004426 [Psilocybe cyanescens]|uniref:Uncharacterized protein n=1 Tax=Psilocybe cyanescens TaxID=93625 RepID=A0A409XVX7_PSICY|nr:hypothetical protein CVT25_004426 [Psilocybe cyanescens]